MIKNLLISFFTVLTIGTSCGDSKCEEKHNILKEENASLKRELEFSIQTAEEQLLNSRNQFIALSSKYDSLLQQCK